jgi:magnesium transporter
MRLTSFRKAALSMQVIPTRLFKKRHPPVGARPGTLVLPETRTPPRIRVITFDETAADEYPLENVEELRKLLPGQRVFWVDVQGLGDEKVLRDLADIFGLHPLALEDLVNVPQRPKAEEYPNHLLIISRMARIETKHALELEQIGVVLGKNYVLTFQERYADVLDPVRARIREGKGPIRHSGADYLAYAIVDALVDAYYPVVEHLEEWLEALEVRVLARPNNRTPDELNRIKSLMLLLRRGLWPMREAINKIIREPCVYVTETVRLYWRDPLDHCAQLVDVIDSQREVVNGLMNMYLSVLSNKTNEVMKVLTIMASIFIPLTFLAGIYGMNFEYMPELRVRWAYPALLIIMALAVAVMLFYFHRNGWIGSGPKDDDEAV